MIVAVLTFAFVFPNYAFAETTPASIITHPPVDMTGINTNQEYWSGGLDPKVVTLGPTTGLHPELIPYDGKIGMNYELPIFTPILAPLDSIFIGFNNGSADFKIDEEGNIQKPLDDLKICFKSTSKDWPGLIYCYYHLSNSPLLRGINITKACSNSKEWPGPMRAGGVQIFTENTMIAPNDSRTKACQALLGRKMKRGDLVGYAGTVGPHSQAPIIVKVKSETESAIVKMGDKYMHWVQPDVFFYWKCYSKTAIFEPGVLAYPFPCDGYALSKAQRNPKFKY